MFSSGNLDKARNVLKNIDSVAPGFVVVRQGRIGLEYRLRQFTQVEALYCGYLDGAQTTDARNFYTWRYAKFAAKVCA